MSQVRISTRGAKRIRQGHLWVYRSDVRDPIEAIGGAIVRAVDEAGCQLAVFGRRGARPFNAEEQRRLYLQQSSDGWRIYTVSNVPRTEPIAPAPTSPPTTKPAATEESPGLSL